MQPAQRRLESLAAHLAASSLEGGPPGGAPASEACPGSADVEGAGLWASPTAATGGASGVQRELQLLLEHDCHTERENMKTLLDTELFVP